jgi:hypothetical protein
VGSLVVRVRVPRIVVMLVRVRATCVARQRHAAAFLLMPLNSPV